MLPTDRDRYAYHTKRAEFWDKVCWLSICVTVISATISALIAVADMMVGGQP